MMKTSTRKSRILMFCLILVFLAGIFHLALHAAGPPEQPGLLTVTGMVKVNGTPASTGDIVAPGSEIQTDRGSSAVVSVGKLGSVEALPSSTVKLRYDNISTSHNSASIAILLGDGGVTVSAGEGIDFFVESGQTSIRPSSRTGQNVFTVDATCGNTLISVAEGNVELHAVNGVKKIAAGGEDSAGQAKPGCAPARYP
jgi:hypothetical protein